MMYADLSAKKKYDPIMLLSHSIRPSGCLVPFPHQPLAAKVYTAAPTIASNKKIFNDMIKRRRRAK